MPLANISVPPSEQQQRAFNFSHYQDHLEIVQAINKQLSLRLDVYPIDPGFGSQAWKQLHQAFHDDMNKALELPQGRDFRGDMDREWYDANWREHSAARAKLRI